MATSGRLPRGNPIRRNPQEKTALREVFEETGVKGKILAEIPGVFRGSTTENKYFLMEPKEDTEKFGGEETQSVRWVTQNQAEELISKTLNPTGKIRDLKLLKAAFEQFRKSPAATT